ncbi:MAG: DMT family transporter [Planctomycetota bacterium]
MPQPADQSKSLVPHLLLTMLVAIWGGSFVVAKVGLETVTPFALVASRFVIGALCVLPFFLRTTREQRRGTFGPAVLAGLVLAIPYFLQMYGVRETTASVGGFMTGLIVILVAAGGALFFHERLGPRALFGLLLGVTGIVVLCLAVESAPGGVQQNTLRGVLLQVGSAFGFAAHILLLSHYGNRLAIAPFTFWQLAFTAVLASAATWLLGGVAADGVETLTVDFGLVLVLAYLGVLATGVAIGVQATVQPKIPPTHVALLFAMQPLFAALSGWLFQGDSLGPWQWAGGALIVLGVIAVARDRR